MGAVAEQHLPAADVGEPHAEGLAAIIGLDALEFMEQVGIVCGIGHLLLFSVGHDIHYNSGLGQHFRHTEVFLKEGVDLIGGGLSFRGQVFAHHFLHGVGHPRTQQHPNDAEYQDQRHQYPNEQFLYNSQFHDHTPLSTHFSGCPKNRRLRPKRRAFVPCTTAPRFISRWFFYYRGGRR